MNIEELSNQVRQELTVTPSEEEVKAGVRAKVASELASKHARVAELEVELQTAKDSFLATEEIVRVLDTPAVEVSTEEVQG